MNKSSFRFTFKPAAESQRELIHSWLQQDYIREWIDGQGLQNTLEGLETFFESQAQGKGLDRQTEIMQHWVGYDDNRPFVYLLTSNVLKDCADEEYTKFCEMEGLAITLDMFIIDTAYLGKGLASIAIKEFLLSQFSDVSEVFIDPEKRNEKATHVYKKVGFQIIGEFIPTWHPVPHHRMRLSMNNLEYT